MDFNKFYLAFTTLSLVLTPHLTQAGLDEGQEAFLNHDYKAALLEFQPLAKKGNPVAQFRISEMFFGGLGIDPDPVEGLKWLILANVFAEDGRYDFLIEDYKTGLLAHHFLEGVARAEAWLTDQGFKVPNRIKKLSELQEVEAAGENGDHYKGQIFGNAFHGKGTYTWANGARYEGDWQSNTRTGQGTYFFLNGDIYTGAFVDGKFNGHGTLTTANGETQTGIWNEGVLGGNVVITLPDGTKIEALFDQGLHFGKGIQTWPKGMRYEGEFKEGKMTGQGMLVLSDGQKYVGDFFENKKHGKGIYSWPNGDSYEGEFEDDRFDGFGKYVFENGDYCEGTWRKGLLLGGKGKLGGRDLNCFMEDSTVKFIEKNP